MLQLHSFVFQAFTEQVQFHTKRSKWKVIRHYEQTVNTIVRIRNMFPNSFLTKQIDRFLRRFQQPNDKKPIILLRLNESNIMKRMILGDGVHEFFRSLNDKLATKFRYTFTRKHYSTAWIYILYLLFILILKLIYTLFILRFIQ